MPNAMNGNDSGRLVKAINDTIVLRYFYAEFAAMRSSECFVWTRVASCAQLIKGIADAGADSGIQTSDIPSGSWEQLQRIHYGADSNSSKTSSRV